MKYMIRVLSFLMKEINEVRRQPRLILSLILGPFLILLLFGAGYQTSRPNLRMILVVPEALRGDLPLEEIRGAIEANFDLVAVTADEAAAMQQLRDEEIEVVQILPANVRERMFQGDQSLVEFKYNDINPYNEQWIRYIAYAEVGEINRALLLQAAREAQAEAAEARQLLIDARINLDELQAGVSAAQRANVREGIERLRNTLDVLANVPLFLLQPGRSVEEQLTVRRQIRELRANLDTLEEAIDSETLNQQEVRIVATREQINELEDTVEALSALPPEVLVAPLYRDYENVRGATLDVMAFYAPGVLMLVLQHIAITLGALSLVRERSIGALELYRVAPVSMLQVLLGKYLGYMLCIGVLAGILVWLMVAGLQVPFDGNPLELVVLLVLFVFSSLGVGLLISLVSGTDSQAVQLSMLSLLFSIFFSGFFLPLDHFSFAINVLGWFIPLTHGIAGSQAIMLKGISPETFTWGVLAAMAAGSFALVLLLGRLQFRHAV